MDGSRILAVLAICLPVFALMGLGKLLEAKGRLNDDHCRFINWLVYNFSLPALLFNQVARQRIGSFNDPAVILMPVLALFIVLALTMAIARFNRYRGGFAAALVFGTYWANATYMGLPLCQNAFGDIGLAKGAIYNGFVVPTFVIVSYLVIGFYGRGEVKIGERIKHALLNPVLISTSAGIAAAFALEPFRSAEGELMLPAGWMAAGNLIGSFLGMIGAMGLPLALLSIGASLKWEQTRSHLGALGWTVGCKLILLPLITLFLIDLIYPHSAGVSLGVPVILSSTPCAVASYVVSCQLGVERGFVSSMLVVSTALSVITIPIWVYVVTGLAG